MTKRTIIQITISLFIIVLGFLLMTGLSSMREEKKQVESPTLKRFVKAEMVEYKNRIMTLSFSGRVVSPVTIDISSEVQGILKKGAVEIRKGSTFKKGETLCIIDNPETEYTLKAARSRFLSNIANTIADIKIDYPNEFETWQNYANAIEIDGNLADLPKISNEKLKMFMASRNILNEFYTIKASEIRYKKQHIVAPFSGSIVNAFLREGSTINMGSKIATVIKTDTYEIEVPVPPSDASWLTKGQKVEVINPQTNIQITGIIDRISSFIDSNTQTVSVFVTISGTTKNPIYQGEYLQCKFNNILIPNAMEIPRSALFNSNEVYTVEEGKLSRRTISISKIGDKTAYFTGLEPGSYVVSESLINASENTQVEIIK